MIAAVIHSTLLDFGFSLNGTCVQIGGLILGSPEKNANFAPVNKDEAL